MENGYTVQSLKEITRTEKGNNVKLCSNYRIIVLIGNVSKSFSINDYEKTEA